ncbi:MAG: tetratricopeptide repeat protein [Acidobacteriota bacterium]|nr:tetratricopeptide repeat protein [Acidobacteriota bacterium]MDH3524824.1 tetratricopeptide repeat protein [Acidobacteriota bacterium]
MSAAPPQRPATTSPDPGFPTRDVLRLLGLRESRLRTWVRAGFVRPGRGPGNRYRFRFQDLVLLRTAQALVESGLPIRRVRRALDRLRSALPQDRSLTELRIVAAGGEVVVEENGEAWEPATGQRRLILDVRDLARSAAPLAAVVPDAAAPRPTARDWHELGEELEATSPREAAAAYRQALELAPDSLPTCLNLGRLLHEEGDLLAAERLYRTAVRHSGDDPTAAFNLGVLLQDASRWREAARAYQSALELDPGYADAYYNLSAVYEQLGDSAVALQNLQAYRRLTRA